MAAGDDGGRDMKTNIGFGNRQKGKVFRTR